MRHPPLGDAIPLSHAHVNTGWGCGLLEDSVVAEGRWRQGDRTSPPPLADCKPPPLPQPLFVLHARVHNLMSLSWGGGACSLPDVGGVRGSGCNLLEESVVAEGCRVCWRHF